MAKILVIEDYPKLQKLYAQVLEHGGHEVEVADDGRQALEIAGRTAFDLIIVDLLLPEVDGMEFLRTFKPADHPGVKVIVFSNFDQPQIIKEALALGAISYFPKAKYTPDEVLQSVNSVLQDAQAAGHGHE